MRHADPITGAPRRTVVYGDTRRVVVDKLKVISTRLDAGKPARDDKMTLNKFTSAWITSSLAASSRKATTKQLYAGLARNHIIGNEIGTLPMNHIKPTNVERFILQLKAKGLSESTVRQVYTIGRAIGDAAVRDGLLGSNPFALVKRPSLTPREAEFLTPEQVSSLLGAASTSRYRPLFELLVNTGLRRGEALALKWSDVDLTNAMMRVRGTLSRVDGELQVTDTKTTKSRRSIPLAAPAVATLRAVKTREASDKLRAGNLWSQTGHVFTTELGEPCDPRNALRALSTAAKTVGLHNVGLHTLRHSAASVMLTNGVPLTVVSQALGHAGIAITADVYGHVSPDVSRSAFDVLASALADPR
jgi:integrase